MQTEQIGQVDQNTMDELRKQGYPMPEEPPVPEEESLTDRRQPAASGSSFDPVLLNELKRLPDDISKEVLLRHAISSNSAPKAPRIGGGAAPSFPDSPAPRLVPDGAPQPQVTLVSAKDAQIPQLQRRDAIPPTTPEEHAQDPRVQKAGLWHTIAETLAGGPRFKPEIDVNTGQTTYKKIPLSRGDIGMAIAMEAISGALGGLQARGPNANAQAAGIGFQQATQRRQQAEQQAKDQAQGDFARHYQVAEANMRMMSIAQTVGKMDQEQHDDLVKSSADYIKSIRDNYPQLLAKEHASEQEAKDLKTYPMHEYARVPDGVTPRMNADGEPIYIANGKIVSRDTPGAHAAYDNTYALVHKTARIAPVDSEGTPQQWLKRAIEWNLLPDSWAKAAPGSEMDAMTAARIARRADALSAADADLKFYYGKLNSANSNSPGDQLLSDERLSPYKELISEAANKHGISQGLLQSLVLTESRGNSKAVSPKGAVGLGQLMPATAKRYGVSDSTDAQQNLDGTAAYLKDLLTSHKGDMRKALIAYHGEGFDGNTTGEQYADQVLGKLPQSPAADKYAPVDLHDAMKKDPSLANSVDKFQAMFNQTGSREAAVAELAKKDPDSAGKVSRLYGGREALHDFDEQQKLSDRLQQQKQDEEIAIDKNEREAKNKLKIDQQGAEHLQEYLEMPKDFNFSAEMADMNPQDLRKNLAAQGVKVPGNLASLYLAAHYKAPVSSFAPRVWTKGSPYEMDQQTAESYIQQFINPQFDATNYAPKQKFRSELVSANSKDGGAIRNAGTAAEHLVMLKQASDALAKHDMPLFNHYVNLIGVQVKGDPGPTDYKAIADKVNSEVEKVAMGGNAPYVEQLKQGADNLSRDFGPKTIDGVLRSYLGLMHGRINTIDEASQSELQEHLHNVSPTVSNLFRQYGLETPWDKGKPTFTHVTRDGKQGYDPQRKQWVPTGQ